MFQETLRILITVFLYNNILHSLDANIENQKFYLMKQVKFSKFLQGKNILQLIVWLDLFF